MAKVAGGWVQVESDAAVVLRRVDAVREQVGEFLVVMLELVLCNELVGYEVESTAEEFLEWDVDWVGFGDLVAKGKDDTLLVLDVHDRRCGSKLNLSSFAEELELDVVARVEWDGGTKRRVIVVGEERDGVFLRGIVLGPQEGRDGVLGLEVAITEDCEGLVELHGCFGCFECENRVYNLRFREIVRGGSPLN